MHWLFVLKTCLPFKPLKHLLLKHLNSLKPTLFYLCRDWNPFVASYYFLCCSQVFPCGAPKKRCGLLVEFLRPIVGHNLFPQPGVETSKCWGVLACKQSHVIHYLLLLLHANNPHSNAMRLTKTRNSSLNRICSNYHCFITMEKSPFLMGKSTINDHFQ